MYLGGDRVLYYSPSPNIISKRDLINDKWGIMNKKEDKL